MQLKRDRKEIYSYINPFVNGRIDINQNLLLGQLYNAKFRYYITNQTGAYVLLLCDGTKSISDIEELLNEKRAQKFLYGFLKLLFKNRILSFSADKKPAKIKIFQDKFILPLDFSPPALKKTNVYKMMSKRSPRLASPLEVYIRLLPGSSNEKIKRIIDNIYSAGVLEVSFSGGDVFSRDDIFELIGYAKDKGMKVFLYLKHGDLLTKEAILKLKSLKLDILWVSLNGPSADIHGIHGKRDAFEKIVANIKSAAESGLLIDVFCIVNRSNVKHMRKFLSLVKSLGVKRMGIDFFKPDRGETDLEKIPRELKFNFFERRCVEFKVKLVSLFSTLKIRPLVRCSAGSINCSVDSEGYVIPCMILPPQECKGVFGNILEDTLDNIWKSRNFKKFINPSSYGAPCANCYFPHLWFLKFFSRCRADCRMEVYVKKGDIFAGNTDCCFANLFQRRREKGVF